MFNLVRNTPEKAVFYRTSLPGFPDLSPVIRCRALFFSWAFDGILLGYAYGFGLQALTGALYYNSQLDLSTFSTLGKVVYFADEMAILYLFWYFGMLALFIIHCIVLLLTVRALELKEKNIALLQLITTKIKLGNTFNYQGKLNITLQRYLAVHLRFIGNVLLLNSELVSPILLTVLLSQFSVNVYAVTLLTMKSLPAKENVILLAVCVLQVALLSMGILPCLRTVTTLHRPALFLAKPQFTLNKRHLSLKIKLLTYYTLLHSDNVHAFTLGPIGKITWYNFLQFICTYGTMLIFSFDIIRKNTLA